LDNGNLAKVNLAKGSLGAVPGVRADEESEAHLGQDARLDQGANVPGPLRVGKVDLERKAAFVAVKLQKAALGVGDELAAVVPGCLWSPERHATLEAWVRRHYRETLVPAELADPKLLDESRTALDELTRLLGTGPIYEFQR